MGAREEDQARQQLERAARERRGAAFVFKLYVAGMTPRSREAIREIRDLCERHLKGRYELEVVDIYRQPERAVAEQIVAAPTLIRKLPLPLRRLIGDMKDREKILVSLDLRQAHDRTDQPPDAG